MLSCQPMNKNLLVAPLALFLGFTSVNTVYAVSRPIDCSDFKVHNVRDCIYTEPDGQPTCNSDKKLCRGVRTKCFYDRLPEYGGGRAFCLKEINVTCSSSVVPECNPTPKPLAKLASGPKPTSSPKSAVSPTPTPKAPGVVTNAKKPSELPKTGANTLGIMGGLMAMSGFGIYIYRKSGSIYPNH